MSTYHTSIVLVWDRRRLQLPIADLSAHKKEVACARTCPHARHLLASGGEDSLVVVWDLIGASEHRGYNALTHAAGAPDIISKYRHNDCIDDVVWPLHSPGALLSSSWDNTVAVLNVDDGYGKLLGTLKGHTDEIYALNTVFEYAFTGSADNDVRVWDLRPTLKHGGGVAAPGHGTPVCVNDVYAGGGLGCVVHAHADEV